MIRKSLILIILIVQLSACSTFGFFYDHLPFFTTWRVDSMFDLDDQQEELVERSTEDIKHWLETEAFPPLISQLKEAKTLWQQQQFKEAAALFDTQTHNFIRDFLNNTAPHLIKLLLTLDQDNAQQYLDYNQDKSEEWFEYSESPASKKASRIERLENWFGELSDEQVRRVGEIALLLPNEQDIRHKNNQHWVRKVIESSLNKNQIALKIWLADTSIWWTPDYKQLKAQNREQTLALVEMMIDSMTPKQQQHVESVVDDWIEKLEDLYD